jgi:transcriptional regulator with XRE-family HTH domain
LRGVVYDGRYAEIVAALRRARKKAGLTQREVARRLGVAQSAVAKLELCELRLDALTMFDLLQLYGLNPDDVRPAANPHLPQGGRSARRPPEAPGREGRMGRDRKTA